MDPSLVTGLVVGPVSAVVVLLITKALNSRTDHATAEKAEAEADSIVQAGYERYIKSLEERLGRLERKFDDLQKKLRDSESTARKLNQLLRSTVRLALTLRDQVIQLGGEIPTMPSDVEMALTTLDQPAE